LESIIANKSVFRDLRIGTNNIRTGGYENYKASELSREDFVNAILSSSAIPILFPAIDFKNSDLYQDGGVSHGIDVLAGINACKSKGYEEKDIVVDIILCFGRTFDEVDPKTLKSMSSLMRLLNIWKRDRGIRDYDEVMATHKQVNFRYFVRPSQKLPNSDAPMEFNKEDTEFMINVGIQDGKDAVGSQNKQQGFLEMKESVDQMRKERTTTKRAVPRINEGLKILE